MEYDYGGEYYRRGHVPAFGSWDWNDAVPFTQCFETATTAQHLNTNPPPGFLHYAPYSSLHPPDGDLYVAGDLYDNHLVAPAMILLPRRRAKVGQEPAAGKRGSSKERQSWKAEMSPRKCSTAAVIKPKPVDEDLYKVSPQVLSAKSKRRKGGNGFGCFSRCFMPTRVL